MTENPHKSYCLSAQDIDLHQNILWYKRNIEVWFGEFCAHHWTCLDIAFLYFYHKYDYTLQIV